MQAAPLVCSKRAAKTAAKALGDPNPNTREGSGADEGCLGFGAPERASGTPLTFLAVNHAAFDPQRALATKSGKREVSSPRRAKKGHRYRWFL